MTELHCTKYLFDKNRLRLLPKIKTLPADIVPKFLHSILDELSNLNGDEGRKETADIMGVTVDQLAPLVACYRLYFKQVIRHSLGAEQIQEDLKALQMEDEIISMIVNTVIARRFTAKAAAVRNTTKISGSYLSDFDWKIHLNLGSDKISKVRRPSVLLSLIIRNTGTGKDEETLLELSPEELSALIDRLRELHGAMVQLRT